MERKIFGYFAVILMSTLFIANLVIGIYHESIINLLVAGFMLFMSTFVIRWKTFFN